MTAVRISDRFGSLFALLAFLLLFGILGSAAETSAFSVSPLAHPAKAPVGTANHNQLHIVHASPPDVEKETVSAEIDEPELPVRLSSKQILPTVGLTSLALLSVAAKVGVLGSYTNSQIAQDVGAALLTGTLGYVFVKGNTWLAEKGYLDPRDSRKIIHTLSAPLFILFWPIFSPADGARFFAASVSFVNIVRLYIAGSGGDKSLAYAVSR